MKHCPKCDSEYEDDVDFCMGYDRPLTLMQVGDSNPPKTASCAKRLYLNLTGAILVALVSHQTGCVTAGLSSSDAATRLKTVQSAPIRTKSVQDKLLEMALDKSEQSEIRIAAFKRILHHQEDGCYVGFLMCDKALDILSREEDPAVRCALWSAMDKYDGNYLRHLVLSSKRHQELNPLVAMKLAGRKTKPLEVNLSDALKREYLEVVWKGREDELLSNYSIYEHATTIQFIVESITNVDIVETFLKKNFYRLHHDEKNGALYEVLTRRFDELNHSRYIDFAKNTSNASLRAMTFAQNDNELVELMTKGKTDSLIEKHRLAKTFIERLQDKSRSEEVLFALGYWLEPIGCAITNEQVMTKLVCEDRFWVHGESEREVVLGKIRSDENLKQIALQCKALSYKAIDRIGSQDVMLDYLKQTTNAEGKKLVQEKLDASHEAKYKEYLRNEAEKAWHAKFDGIIARAKQDDISAICELINDAVERNDDGDCLRWAKEAVRVSPKVAQYQHELGTSYYALGDYTNAIKHLDEALSLGSAESEPYLNMASCLFANKVEKGSLDDCLEISSAPDKRHCYTYSGGSGFECLKVFQALPQEGAVLVRASMLEELGADIPRRYSRKTEVIYIRTKEEYVDGNYLRAGAFLYDGPVTYATAIGASKTVHGFHEWKAHRKMRPCRQKER